MLMLHLGRQDAPALHVSGEERLTFLFNPRWLIMP